MNSGDKVTIYNVEHKPIDMGTYDGEYLANKGTAQEVTVYSATGQTGIGYLSIDGYYFEVNPVSPFMTSYMWIGAAIAAAIILYFLSKEKR